MICSTSDKSSILFSGQIKFQSWLIQIRNRLYLVLNNLIIGIPSDLRCRHTTSCFANCQNGWSIFTRKPCFSTNLNLTWTKGHIRSNNIDWEWLLVIVNVIECQWFTWFDHFLTLFHLFEFNTSWNSIIFLHLKESYFFTTWVLDQYLQSKFPCPVDFVIPILIDSWIMDFTSYFLSIIFMTQN